MQKNSKQESDRCAQSVQPHGSFAFARNIKIIQGFQDPLIMIAASCLKNTVEICMESVLSHGLFAINSLKCLLHVYMLKVLM